MTTPFTPADPHWLDRLQQTVAGQPMMQMLGVAIHHAEPGDVTIRVDHHDRLRQHHGYLHGGVTAMLADEACGLSALSLVGPNNSVVTSDLSVSFLRPGVGQRYEARATVIRPGRNLTALRCEVHAYDPHGTGKLIGIAQATTMTLDKR